MRVSAEGRGKIRQREGEVLHTYFDSVGVATCCVGHTGRSSPPTPRPGQTFTKEQSDAFLTADLVPVENALSAALDVPVTQNEFDAMASLYFNVGTGYVPGSSIVRALNRGDVAAAAAGFDNYHKPAAIIGRRNTEKAQFQEPDHSTAAVATSRAADLHDHAAAVKTATKTTATSGVLVGAGAAASIAASGSHHWLGIAAVVLLGLAGLVALVVILGQKKAATLTANAQAQEKTAAAARA